LKKKRKTSVKWEVFRAVEDRSPTALNAPNAFRRPPRFTDECDAEYTSVWKIWPSTATEMPSDASGKFCTDILKEISGFKRTRW
jgi:hypothetical protein